MTGKWKVTSQYLGETQKFAVYRMIDINEVDHSGNREFASGYLESREEAVLIAKYKNAENQESVN